MAIAASVAIGRFLAADAPAPMGPAPPVRSTDDSIAALEARVRTDPNDVGAWQGIGVAYLQRAASIGDPAFYGLAENAFDRAAELAPDDPTTVIGQGALALALHRFPEALELGIRATQMLPASADAWAVLVDAQVEMGYYADAENSLQRMLDLRPGLPALARTSYLRELHGDVPGAIEAMTRAAAAGSRPDDVARVSALLGDLYLLQGHLEAATAAYEEALESSPMLVSAGVGRARALATGGQLEEAVGVLEGVIERFPAPEAVVLLGDLQTRAGRSAEAAETYALVEAIAALQEDAGQVVDLEMAVFVADRGEDSARAVELARAAHQVRPANVYVNDALAWALLTAGDAPAAVAPMEEALRLGSADPLVRFHAAEVFLAVGDVDRARAELAQALGGTVWFSFRHHERALELAGQLDVTVSG
ncbi:MAG TPA: tetratricopeptide repeat protein [Acidimicrobiales bacterium]|nr:tetratricopeptide repeat protein [Acidimicrobiales bacterium]